MNDKPIFKIRFILHVAMPTAAKIQYSFSEVLIPLFQQTIQPEKEVETLKIILILAPCTEKKHSQNDPVWDKQTLITHFQWNPVTNNTSHASNNATTSHCPSSLPA